jgi:hypothetical protein
MRAALSAVLLQFTLAGPLVAEPTTFSVPDRELSAPLVLVTYGDMRFTDSAETGASNPAARRALVDKIAAETPAAIFINGDLTWHGIDSDYAVYRDETRPWRKRHLRVYRVSRIARPALVFGRHGHEGGEHPARHRHLAVAG